MEAGKAKKQDYEYVRRGKANIFMAVEPKGGKRITQITDQRTRKDFAYFLRMVVKKYAGAECIRIVLDNLNTHNEKSLFENFWSEQADEILSKIEFHYTPKHASWLNVAEIEIGVMDRECTDRRIKDKEMLKQEVKVWTMKKTNSERKSTGHLQSKKQTRN